MHEIQIGDVTDSVYRPRKWPHFMEKKHKRPDQIYKSEKILGRLYDQVQLVDFKPQWSNSFDERILSAFELDEPMLHKSREIKKSYDESLRRLMAKHGIRTEFEAWSVFVLEHNHESRDYKFAEEFGRTVEALKSQYRETCRAQMSSSTSSQLFVAAMYTVTAQEMSHALAEWHTTKFVGGQEIPVRSMDPEHMPLISFPWLFTSELGKIATGSARPTVPSHIPLSQQTNGVKHRSHKADGEVKEVGTVETASGVTHYGEILSLDFGSPRDKIQGQI